MINDAETSATLACLTLHRALDDLEAEAQHAVDGEDLAELAAVHVDLTRARRRLAMVAAFIEDALADAMPDKVLELPGLPSLELRSGKKRTAWQSLDLFDELLHRCAVDPDTGEVIDDPDMLRARIRDVLAECVPFTGSLGWRVKALAAAGITVDEWCTTTPGRPTVQVHEAAIEAVA